VREFEVFHRMSERIENCDECSGALFKVPSTTFTTVKTDAKDKTGQVVKEFIEDAREEIQAEKEKMKEGLDK
tara:strand:- start:261 stop:476 length:216 start_codon:yes stop_codon:yes gene_type:complete